MRVNASRGYVMQPVRVAVSLPAVWFQYYKPNPLSPFLIYSEYKSETESLQAVKRFSHIPNLVRTGFVENRIVSSLLISLSLPSSDNDAPVANFTAIEYSKIAATN